MKLFILLLTLLCCQATWAVDNIDYQISGASDDVEANIRAYLSTLATPNANELNNFNNRVRKNTDKALQAFGYYKSTIILNLTLDTEALVVFIKLKLRQRVKLASVDIKIEGEAKSDAHFSKLLKQSKLTVGSYLRHDIYELFKLQLSRLALARGYFDGRWTHNEIAINTTTNEAQINLVYASEKRYKFSDTLITLPVEAEKIVLNIAPYERGDYYDDKLISSYNLELLNSQYFRSVSVRADIANRKDNQVQILVELLEHASNTYEVGIGYLSDVGMRGKVSWTKPWLNRHGHRVSAAIEYSRVLQEYTFAYDIPLEDPVVNIARVQAGFQQKDNADTNTELYTVKFQRQYELSRRTLRTWFIKWERERYTQGLQQDQSLMILPGISFARARKKGGFDPYKGYQHLFSIEFADQIWGADVDMAKLQTHSKVVYSIDKTHFFTTRLDLGAIWVNDILSVPASMRFFTGGSPSIRGFKYERVAPLDDSNQLIGGRYLTVGSLEYGYKFAQNWRSSIFVDAGTATNDFSEQLSVGVGVGLRWLTLIGPVTIDVGVPIQGRTDDNYNIHLTVGPEV